MSKRNYPRKGFHKKSNPAQRNFESVAQYELTPLYGYAGFMLYFKDDDGNVEKIIENTQSFESHIHRNANLFNFTTIKEQKFANVDLLQLYGDDAFLKEWDTFKEDIITKSEHCLMCMGLALHQIIAKEIEKQQESGKDRLIKTELLLPMIRCRLKNHEPVLQIKNLGVSSFGKLVTIRGTLIKASTEKLQCDYMCFECGFCGGSQVVKQIDGVYKEPMKCKTKGCKVSTKFIPLLSSPHTKVVNRQSLKIQELVGNDGGDAGRVPKTVECEVEDDLVGSCVPGDDIVLTGIVRVHNASEVNNKDKQATMYLLYIDGVSIVNERSRSNQGITFNRADYYAIHKIHEEPNKFQLFVQSLCPNIFGHDIVKAGLILALFGGTNNDVFRSDSHVLMVGDPGLGKSQMLQSCSNVAPRGIFVCGNSTTTSGLTVTMSRDGGGEFALEAGALVLADQGILCIDEFDKMSAQHSCLLEVMEQQCISIAKAGVSCNLPARPSILAAANPAGGHYNKAKTIAENIKISAPLLSRFDLVFILVDNPNKEVDILLSEHILDMSDKRSGTTSGASTSMLPPESKLIDRLRIHLGETNDRDRLPHVLLRKYIAYARKYVHPELNSEAQKLLKEFYMDLRRQYHKGDSTPVTTRQLLSLKRLTQARAKLDLREEATAADAKDVIEIMKYSLVDIFSDGKGHLDFTRSQNGSGVSNSKLVKKYLGALKHKSDILTRSIFTLEEMRELGNAIGLSKEQFSSILDSINLQGYVIKKGGSKYQLVFAN